MTAIDKLSLFYFLVSRSISFFFGLVIKTGFVKLKVRIVLLFGFKKKGPNYIRKVPLTRKKELAINIEN